MSSITIAIVAREGFIESRPEEIDKLKNEAAAVAQPVLNLHNQHRAPKAPPTEITVAAYESSEPPFNSSDYYVVFATNNYELQGEDPWFRRNKLLTPFFRNIHGFGRVEVILHLDGRSAFSVFAPPAHFEQHTQHHTPEPMGSGSYDEELEEIVRNLAKQFRDRYAGMALVREDVAKAAAIAARPALQHDAIHPLH